MRNENFDEGCEVCAAFDLRWLKRYALRTSYPEVVRDVRSLYQRLPAGQRWLVVDGSGVGRAVTDMFGEAGVPCIVITITHGMHVIQPEGQPNEYHVPKRDLVASVQKALQTRSLRFAASLPEVSALQTELQNFEVKISTAGADS
jgi:hypothetical protein